MLNHCRPDLILDRLEHLDLQLLAERGIRALLLDLDNTLCTWGSRELSGPRREWVESARRRFRLCIVSNTVLGRRLRAVGADLQLPTVARWGVGRKPFAGAIRAGLKITGSAPQETAIVGDQVFADILGGNRLGLLTVWIPPLDPREFISTMCVRGAERLLLRHLGCTIPARQESANA